jgi:hypothetical protein
MQFVIVVGYSSGAFIYQLLYFYSFPRNWVIATPVLNELV